MVTDIEQFKGYMDQCKNIMKDKSDDTLAIANKTDKARELREEDNTDIFWDHDGTWMEDEELLRTSLLDISMVAGLENVS